MEKRHRLTIVDYDPRWPSLYREEAARIREAAGSVIVATEHIGSTAVPGLGAKPVIDIMVGLRHMRDAEQCIEPLKDLGYEYVPEYEVQIPERRYFRKPRGTEWVSTHHIHMVKLGGSLWQRDLLFRDYLRTHTELAREYHELKKRMALKHAHNRDSYTDSKSSFIESVIMRARAERALSAGS